MLFKFERRYFGSGGSDRMGLGQDARLQSALSFAQHDRGKTGRPSELTKSFRDGRVVVLSCASRLDQHTYTSKVCSLGPGEDRLSKTLIWRMLSYSSLVELAKSLRVFCLSTIAVLKSDFYFCSHATTQTLPMLQQLLYHCSVDFTLQTPSHGFRCQCTLFSRE